MSFSEHPYRHLSLVDIDDDGSFYWYCDSCGADGKRSGGLNTKTDPIERIINSFHTHVRMRHGLTREDVKDWSTGF